MMRGLGSGAAGMPQQPTQGVAEPAATGSPQGGEQSVSPEEQAQYEAFVKGAQEIIYPQDQPEQINPAILGNLKGQFDPSALEVFQKAEPPLTDSPQDSLAATAVLLTMMSEARDQSVTDDVVMHGGVEIMEDLIDVAEASGIHDFSEEEIEGMTYRAMDLYRIASPRADPAALTAQFKELMAANEQGNLHSILPGLPGGPAMEQKG